MKTLAVAGVLILVGAGFAVAVKVFGWSEIIGKAWAISYEVSAQAGAGPVKVTYLENPDTFKRDAPSTVSTEVTLPWKVEVVINSGQPAEVVAAPGPDQVLTCRILLDDQKVLASAVSAGPGQPVKCTKVTDK